MNGRTMGELIRALRHEKQMTQKDLANQLQLSSKTISKWECGQGFPDISLLNQLAKILEVDLRHLLDPNQLEQTVQGDNMQKTIYYVCPVCGNLTITSGAVQLSCCGRTVQPLPLYKASLAQQLTIENLDAEWWVTSDHPMTKENYISFVAWVSCGSVYLVKQYPEWKLSCYFPKNRQGMLVWYSRQDGLLYQKVEI